MQVSKKGGMQVSRKSKRYVRHVSYLVVREHEPANREQVGSPEQAAALARRLIADDDREHFWTMFLDSQNRVTAVHHVSTGTLSASIVHPREVLGPALREGAAAVVLAHNHPSGDPTPSKEDLALTQQLVEGARILGLRVHDHIIIGNGTSQYVSLAARGQL
jgi:DNA repair protein RadC